MKSKSYKSCDKITASLQKLFEVDNRAMIAIRDDKNKGVMIGIKGNGMTIVKMLVDFFLDHPELEQAVVPMLVERRAALLLQPRNPLQFSAN